MNRQSNKPRGFLSTRRLALLAGIAGVGAAVVMTQPNIGPHMQWGNMLTRAYAAVPAAAPAGFADVVEKVKPAVISVRVKVEGAQPASLDDEQPMHPGSPFERF